jgi:general stress protein YciG
MADDNKPRGRGWHGDSAGHARAGRLGGQRSKGNFKHDRVRASAAGRSSRKK